MSELKVGDKVWVRATAGNTEGDRIQFWFSGNVALYLPASDCRPVEPSNSSEIPNSSSKPWTPKVGERVRLIETGHIYEIESYSETYAQYSMQGWPGSCVNLEDIEPVNSPKILDSSIDPINPSHYKQGGIECIEAIKAALGEGFPDYLRGNVMKYLWRYKEKGGADDLRKSAWYLDRLIQEVGE